MEFVLVDIDYFHQMGRTDMYMYTVDSSLSTAESLIANFIINSDMSFTLSMVTDQAFPTRS